MLIHLLYLYELYSLVFLNELVHKCLKETDKIYNIILYRIYRQTIIFIKLILYQMLFRRNYFYELDM